MNTNRVPNRLIDEKSPYLLQHAYNPVDWFPWGTQAFEKAKAEDKPVFLSIGYSTCHWCHVMERESFEDEEVAALLNKNFISIKVDREERPDVDSFYMDACMTLNGSGGWPLSCFLTYDKKPFFTGTYFPKNDGMYGTGFVSLINQITKIWKSKKEDLTGLAESVTIDLNSKEKSVALKQDRTGTAFRQLQNRFDPKYGGFGGAPKFPSVQNLLFLIRYGMEHHEKQAFEMVRKTLDHMRNGGIYDHIGGGFCRYSTDSKWLVPHFEKMMTDNAMHIMAYSEAAALFGGRFGETAKQIIEFCTREMLDSAGGFYTATDADSEGVEGKYYVFSPDDVKEVLGEEDSRRYCTLYHITQEGNFEGKNIPNLTGTNMTDDDFEFAKRCNGKMLSYRSKRIPPFLDDKVLVLVNGLMIAALSVEGRILKDSESIAAAERCASFVLAELVKDGRLLSRWRNGESGIPASSDDYASLIWGLIELYEATFNPRWLEQAVLFTDRMEALFHDPEDDGYYLAGSDVSDLPVRQKNIQDGALPSGNSMMALNLVRLARLCANEKYEKTAGEIVNLTAPLLNSHPSACCGLLCSMVYLENGGTEVILATGENFDSLCAALPAFSPFTVTAACGSGFEAINNAAPYLENYRSVEGKAAAYVCKGGSCRQPLTAPEELKNLFNDSVRRKI